ncbi:DUF1294 domain-containing protein [uncultured Ruminococcus sp.]|uniref:DUF1294 domain-containing protein n=1 Tax=uncultured Ruminococcus sp. TaxID=165186 RepID=UPI0025D65028|nr:DUF1294 domain-containing protein [uncultured Ruminococcus sp.]
MDTLKYIIIYLAAMSVVTFILFGADKHKAKAHKWRIPEKTLLGLSLLGGFSGGFLGMEFFRHKTKHWYFYSVMIVSLVLWLGVIYKVVAG